jgi:hypothetical protein
MFLPGSSLSPGLSSLTLHEKRIFDLKPPFEGRVKSAGWLYCEILHKEKPKDRIRFSVFFRRLSLQQTAERLLPGWRERGKRRRIMKQREKSPSRGATALTAYSLVALSFLGCVSTGPPPDGEPPGQEKVVICHKGKRTLTVAAPAAEAHLRHGDRPGSCPG